MIQVDLITAIGIKMYPGLVGIAYFGQTGV